VLLSVALLAALTLWAGPTFATWTNVTLILGAAAITALYAAAVAFGVIAGALDLSVPGTAALAGVLTGELVTAGCPAVPAVMAGVSSGMIVGAVNGIAVAWGLNALVVTIAMLSILSGIAAVIADGVPVSGVTQLDAIGTASYIDIPGPVFLVAAVYAAGTLFLTQTRAGARLLAVGGGAETARRAGVASDRYRTLGFVLSGACAALGGIVTAATITQASPTVNAAVLFDALTAVAVSGMPLTGGRGSLPRVLVGALIIASIASAIAIKGVPPYWTTVATGLLLVAALTGERVVTGAGAVGARAAFLRS
jgi:ribose transport system permease protein